jgi:hypothetical protein
LSKTKNKKAEFGKNLNFPNLYQKMKKFKIKNTHTYRKPTGEEALGPHGQDLHQGPAAVPSLPAPLLEVLPEEEAVSLSNVIFNVGCQSLEVA